MLHDDPTSSCITGARYCVNPSVDRLTRRAEDAKSSSGTAVAGPVSTVTRTCGQPSLVKVTPPPRPVTPSTTSAPTAIGRSQSVSIVSPLSASTVPPTRFFTSPYNPNENASVSEIHGTWP